VTRLVPIVVLAAVAALAAAPAAGAHIQVSPATAAPGDAVKVTLLVPNEEGKPTTRLELKIPADVLPFSYEATPGWTRKVVAASNGSVDKIVWTGSLPGESFVEFSFLAAMPEKPGDVSWKALQVYAGGETVRWIGPPGSEQPAAVTKVAEGVPLQNAGGENAEGGGGTTTTAPTETTAPAAETTSAAPAASASEGDDNDWVALVIGVAGLILGFVALLLVLTRKKEAT
jgi:uncharacterized protein YcnI